MKSCNWTCDFRGDGIAVIFDLDGVIADTQRLQSSAESAILKEIGIYLSPNELSVKYAGVCDRVMFGDILKRNAFRCVDVGKLIEAKWEFFDKYMKEITPIPHAVSLIGSFKSSGCKLAVASGSPRRFVDMVLKKLSILSHFDSVVSSEEVSRGKPWPDVFLEASSRVAVQPSHCIVIEDGLAGMEGAKAAGMFCIGLVSNKDIKSPADLTVSCLSEIEGIKGTLFKRFGQGKGK